MRLIICAVLLLLCDLARAAELQVPEQFDLLRVNGQEYKTYFQRTKMLALRLGRNEIEMEFNKIYDAESGDSHDRIRSQPFTVLIEVAVDNEVWQLQAELPEFHADAVRYSKNPTYQLQKNGMTVALTNAAAEIVVSNAIDQDALAMLNLWWAKASVEQRQEFLREVLSKP